MQTFYISIICLSLLILMNCQKLVYYCNFDAGLIDNCVFDQLKEEFTLTETSAVIPSHLNPTEPLSDVTSIRSVTTLHNEPCLFPYNYPNGNWSMYFCEAHSSNNLTCPTASGIGNCVIGKYAQIKTYVGDFDQTYSINISTKSNTVHCLDFFYYLTDALEEAKMTIGWKSNEDTISITEVTASSENKWQQSRRTYISSSSESNQIWFRMTRKNASSRVFTYALDEIKIFEGACETILSSSNILSDSSFITDQTSEVSSVFTSDMVDTVSTIISDTTMNTDETKLTTNDDIKTTSIYVITDEETSITTANTSEFSVTTEMTSETKSTTISTTTIITDPITVPFRKKMDLITTLSVSFGLSIPSLIIIIGGLCYHYRRGQRISKALSDRTGPNDIPLTLRNV